MKRYIPCLIVLLITSITITCINPEESRLAKIHLDEVLNNGKPTLAEFGWRECVPCKSMRIILEETEEEYKGMLNVVIVEIPFNEDLAEKYGIRVMPTQIFFDNKGEEITRHAGFLPKEEIVAQLQKIGIQNKTR